MGLLDLLPGPPLRQPAQAVIGVGLYGNEPFAEADEHLTTLEVVTSCSEAWTARLSFETRRDAAMRWAVVDSGQFAATSRVSIGLRFGTRKEPLFSGCVKESRTKLGQDGVTGRFEVDLQDLSILLDGKHIQDSASPQLSDYANISAMLLASGTGLTLANEAAKKSTPGRTITQDSTVIRFIRERAEATGFQFFPVMDKVKSGTAFYFGPISFNPEDIAQTKTTPIRCMMGWDTNCISFDCSDAGKGAHSIVIPPETKTGEGHQEASRKAQTITPDLPSMGKTKLHVEQTELAALSTVLQRQGDATDSELELKAMNMANRNSLRITATGELDGNVYGQILWVGQLVPVIGAGERASGIYYVNKVKHTLGPDGYRQSFELLRNAVGWPPGLVVKPPVSNYSSVFG